MCRTRQERRENKKESRLKATVTKHNGYTTCFVVVIFVFCDTTATVSNFCFRHLELRKLSAFGNAAWNVQTSQVSNLAH